MKKEHIFSISIILIFWQIASIIVGNDIFVPAPMDVFSRMLQQLFSYKFIIVIFGTFQRTLIAFAFSLILGVLFGLLAGCFKIFERLFTPFDLLLKSIPNISYMFILLLTMGSKKAVYYIIFFIVFPIIYNATLSGIKSMDDDLKDVLLLYNESFSTKFYKIYFFQALPYVKACTYSTMTLGLKVCIMSEVLGQVKYGIGKEMYVNKINLDMIGVFSWTIWVILLVFIIEIGLKFLLSYFDK